ncbi:MAG: hypothetical protein V1735_04480 [Nanoarchaeota archaeon]
MSNQKAATVLKATAKEKVALSALDAMLASLRFKEYLILGTFVIGSALLRVPMQALPSVEPISFFAFLAGWLFGWRKGAATGALALGASNFLVMGGQGPWTIFQAAGFAAIGAAGGLMRKRASLFEVVPMMVIATVFYEVCVNLGSAIFMPFALPVLFLTAIPFTLIHVGSNLAFAFALPKAKKFVDKKGGFDERRLAEELQERLRGKKR